MPSPTFASDKWPARSQSYPPFRCPRVPRRPPPAAAFTDVLAAEHQSCSEDHNLPKEITARAERRLNEYVFSMPNRRRRPRCSPFDAPSTWHVIVTVFQPSARRAQHVLRFPLVVCGPPPPPGLLHSWMPSIIACAAPEHPRLPVQTINGDAPHVDTLGVTARLGPSSAHLLQLVPIRLHHVTRSSQEA
ncbi:hypothetical protein BD626DRAFT_475568 [Schizophyllum amplum]|uniref:Uncharacterized protein n=1 Tax=Schizophyllum amplum TaxID=97359 RepID=A0A550CYJ3_9AGAR|nr:hypothetical protein BD626DRAFT_475568 [Auriculariopsis ampla]